MALTVEEKLTKLKALPEWFAFTENQQKFLIGVAEGKSAAQAVADAYPKAAESNRKHGTGGLRGTIAVLCANLRIKEALVTIEATFSKPIRVKTREEILAMVSDRMDSAEDNDQFLKFVNTFAKIAGWEKLKEPDPDEGTNLDEVVAALEKKRKK